MEITHLIGVYSNPNGRSVTYPNNGDVVQLIDVIVDARALASCPVCSDESEEVAYFKPSQLPVEIVSPVRPPIADAFEDLRGVLR